MTRSALQRVSRVGLGRIGEAVRVASHLLLVLVMLARALVPAGFMPERDARTGEIVVAMCSGKSEHQTITVKLPGGPSRKDGERKDCPFANTITSVASQSQPHLAPTVVHFPPDYPPALAASPAAPMRRPNAPPTGPPAFA